jgi:hypothetical protein
MRRFFGVSVAIALSACNGGTTMPLATVIDVHVLDDAGAAVDRTQVDITMATAKISGRTGTNGNASIEVGTGGTYSVVVTPRSGYLDSETLRRTVTVAPNGRATIAFTVYRQGNSTPMPPTTDW